jgi:hypothetical protein
VAYTIENALFQWEEGEARIRDAEGAEARELDRAARVVVEELRARLGGTFTDYAGGRLRLPEEQESSG